MKRLWIAAALLVAIFCAMLYNTHFLCRFSGELAQALEQAEAYAEQGDWRRAESMTRQAYDLWQSRDSYLHITLRHADTDLI